MPHIPYGVYEYFESPFQSGFWDIWNTNPLLGGGEFGGPHGGGGGRFFGRKQRPRQIELLSSALGQPVPLYYGPWLIAGNIIHVKKNNDGSRTVIVALGEGEFDKVVCFWVNGRAFDFTEKKQFHFHPGLDGEVGVETSNAVRNQKKCKYLPASFPFLTFSRTAYVAIKVSRNLFKKAKGQDIDVRGVYNTTRVRIFDSAGTQTGYAFSTNPAWICLDVLLRRQIKPFGKLNEALTNAEKAFIDFAAFKAWADVCDVDIGGGKKRFEAAVAFDQGDDLRRALDLILFLGQADLIEVNGKYKPIVRRAKSSVLTVRASDILPGSFSIQRRQTREAPNKLVAHFANLESGETPGTVSSSGKTVTGVDTKFTDFFQRNDWGQVRTGAQKDEVRIVASDPASDLSLSLKKAHSAGQAAGTRYGNPALDFSEASVVVEDLARQVELGGREVVFEADLGAQTPERAERLVRPVLLEQKLRNLVGFQMRGDNGAADLAPGDVITTFSDLEFDESRMLDYEIVEAEDAPEGHVALSAREYDPAVFSDQAGAQQTILPAAAEDLGDADEDSFSTVAADEKSNLFGNPTMVGTGALPALAVGTLHAWQGRKSGSGGDAEYRNNGEIRLPAPSAAGWVELFQFKKRDAVLRDSVASEQFWVRKLAETDPDPNGDLILEAHFYNQDGTFISTTEIRRWSTDDLVLSNTHKVFSTSPDPFRWTFPPGADRAALGLRLEAPSGSAGNVDLYVTQGMLNRGPEAAIFTEATDLADVRQYAYEGYKFVDDPLDDTNGVLISAHRPNTRGLLYAKLVETGNAGKQMDIQSNVAKRLAETVSASTRFYYKNGETPISKAYKVSCKTKTIGATSAQGPMIVGRALGSNNHYQALLRGDGTLELFKVVAGVRTSLGSSSIGGFSASTEYLFELQLTDAAKKVLIDSVEKINSADDSLTGADPAGFGCSIGTAATASERCEVNDFFAQYLQNVAAPGSPPEPPPDPPGGGGDGDILP